MASGSGMPQHAMIDADMFGPSDDEEDDDETQTTSKPGGKDNKQHYFFKELRCLMYGFGDAKQPYTETVELLEQLVVDYIQAMTRQCMQTGKPGKIALEDIWYLTRRDPKKFARVKDLLAMSEELRRARKAFDEAKY